MMGEEADADWEVGLIEAGRNAVPRARPRPKAKKLSAAMLAALKSARDHGDPTRHLRGQDEFGGWAGTRLALLRRGLLDRTCTITPAGRAALIAAGILEPTL